MSSILTINGGSSSIRFAVYEAGETPRLQDDDHRRNASNAPLISPDAGRVKVRVIRTDEELTIARSVSRVLKLGPT